MTHTTRFRATQFMLLLVLAGSVCADDSPYTFSINGEPVRPVHYSLNGDGSVMAPGDVIYVGDKQFDYGGLYITLGEERDCRFIAASNRTRETQAGADSEKSPWDSRVFLEFPDGRRKIVGLQVSWNTRRQPVDPNATAQGKNQATGGHPSSERIPYNPLDSLSPEEIHGLWGIALVQWPKGIEQQLAHVNTDRVCIAVNNGAGVSETGASSPIGGMKFPPIPVQTRYLVVAGSLRDFSHFRQFHDLAFLKFESSASGRLDASLICENMGLRHLDISGCDVPNYQKLAALTELRFLGISWCREIENIEFAKDMRQLRTLSLSVTRISSLSPLDHSDSIRTIYAGMTMVRDLPQGDLASLRSINLIATKVDAQTVAKFRTAHPACKVEYGWADSLRTAVQGTTRLRIRSGGTCHRHPELEKVLAEITDSREIDRFMTGIVIDENQSGGACMCCGDPTFEFYAGERLLAMVGYHHGERLRWADGLWTGDGELTGPSRAFLISWLAEHGVQGPRREAEERQKRQDEEARRQRRYAELIPQEILSAALKAEMSVPSNDDPRGEKRLKLVAEVFVNHEKDAQTSIELYLRVLGVTANSHGWNAYFECQDAMAKNLLPRFKGPELAQAVTNVMKDEEGMMGAARWFLGENGWRNLDESDRERILPPLAQRALQHRSMDTRKEVMKVLSEINSPWATQSLRSMLSRPTDANWKPPRPGQAKYGWRIDLVGGEQVCSDECSDAVWAAFCLAKMGDLPSLPAIERLAAQAQGRDKELLEKALQLLRDQARKSPKASN